MPRFPLNLEDQLRCKEAGEYYSPTSRITDAYSSVSKDVVLNNFAARNILQGRFSNLFATICLPSVSDDNLSAFLNHFSCNYKHLSLSGVSIPTFCMKRHWRSLYHLSTCIFAKTSAFFVDPFVVPSLLEWMFTEFIMVNYDQFVSPLTTELKRLVSLRDVAINRGLSLVFLRLEEAFWLSSKIDAINTAFNAFYRPIIFNVDFLKAPSAHSWSVLYTLWIRNYSGFEEVLNLLQDLLQYVKRFSLFTQIEQMTGDAINAFNERHRES